MPGRIDRKPSFGGGVFRTLRMELKGLLSGLLGPPTPAVLGALQGPPRPPKPESLSKGLGSLGFRGLGIETSQVRQTYTSKDLNPKPSRGW